jgi:hypothetical protein
MSRPHRRPGMRSVAAVMVIVAVGCLAGCATGDTATLHQTQARVRKLAKDLPLPPGFIKTGSYDEAAVPPHAVGGGRSGTYHLHISGPTGVVPAQMVPTLDTWFTTHSFERVEGSSGTNGCQEFAHPPSDPVPPGGPGRFATFQWANAALAFTFDARLDDPQSRTELTIWYEFDHIETRDSLTVRPYTGGSYTC